ncbi:MULTISPECIES: hypothetical protein [Photorhabdus]|nr:hypothetical protein [Photorhabdus hindustanensis]
MNLEIEGGFYEGYELDAMVFYANNYKIYALFDGEFGDDEV